MQCPNCQFQNMPGITLCGRCGASLQLQQASIDVHPPRATAQRKRLRRWFPTFRAAQENLHALGTAVTREVTQNENPPEWPVVWRTVIPGWAHRYCGYSLRAKLFFYSYFALVILGLFCLGTFIGNLLLGLAVSCHASSILDLVLSRQHGIGRRIFLSLLAFGLLFCVIYYPAWTLLRRVALPITIQVEASPLEAGDVLLTQSLLSPDVGDVVVYQLPNTPTGRGYQMGRAAVVRFFGQRVDRILAGPGQTVEIKSGEIWVDDRPATILPLNPKQFSTMKKITVGANQWWILPSTDQYAQQANEILLHLSLVDQDQVQGTVWIRSRPLSRMGRVKSLAEE